MTVWRGALPLVLASQSRARQMLLANAGIDFEAVPAALDERALQQKFGLSSPDEIAALLACEKALAISRGKPERLVVGADQTLSLADHMYTKPSDRTQALAQLKELSGRSHELHSAVAVAEAGEIVFEHIAMARLTMRAMSETEIAAYIEQAGEAVVTSSVGAYQLEGLGAHLFERIEGDHFTILGLPLLPLLDFLRKRHLLAI